ncbi:MAG TPA: hypothetical protein VNZ26_34460, partial [Vicinamibacterales bacterium]|nr:hypothetical protein [Vicinamibacterales bacterium]
NREGVYVYDYPQLFLFTLGLVLLCRENLIAYYPLLFLGVFSKETNILLVLVFFVTNLRRSVSARLLSHTAAQLALFLIGTLFLRWRYRTNPGFVVEWHLLDHNLGWLLHRVHPGTLTDALVSLGVTGFIVQGWKQKPRFLRRAAIVIWPLLGTALFFGWLEELRDYYEAYAVLLSLAAFTAGNLLGAAPVIDQ